jgi:predicted ATPase/DNA-binding CsgD family transcriptional regulator
MEPGIHGDAGAEFNAFIGRDRELGELRVLAAGARALTLCGAGGIGKTRLALHLLAELAPGFSSGAWFVELADLRQPELVASRVAAVLGISEEPGRPLVDTIADTLRSRQLLLCLDNCEHLIDACAQLGGQLLARVPGLRVLTTSREPLRVAAETVWQVPPLSLPSAAADADAEPFTSDALRLFADRAAAARPDFVLGPANRRAVTAICQALDGLPLAIELAAAWVRVLTADQIADRLVDRFRLLNSASRTAPERHRTLRAAIDWSYDLLSAPEKVLMRRLSLFAGWPLEMAEQLCAQPGDINASQVVDLLTALADQSLVIVEQPVPGKLRYRMLDTIRQYAAEQLELAGETELLAASFAAYAVREVEELAAIGMAQVPAPWSARVDAIHRFEADNANLRQVLGWALAHGELESGLRICASMRPVWIIHGSFAEGARWLDAFLLKDTSGLPDPVLGAALVGRAQLAMATDPEAAREFALQGLRRCQDAGSAFWAASALNLLAEVALHAGELDEATVRARNALAVAGPAGDRWNEGYGYGTLATAAAFGGDLLAARKLAETALGITREIDQQWGAARALIGLGDLARLTGELDQARHRYQDALEIVRDITARPEIARCLAGLGRVAMSQGELALASRYFGESLTLSQSTGSRIGVIRGLDVFAALATEEGDPSTAVRLTAAAAALRQEAGLPPTGTGRLNRILAAAAGLGDEVIQRLLAEGSSLGSDAAVALALGGRAASEAAAPGHAGPVAARLAQEATPAPAAKPAEAAALTGRETEIVPLIAAGASNKAIAAELGITTATAARHVANIMAKLGVSSRAQIAARAANSATPDH